MFDCVSKMPLLPVKKKRNKLSYRISYVTYYNILYFTWCYIILYNLITCSVFIDIKKTLHYKIAIA